MEKDALQAGAGSTSDQSESESQESSKFELKSKPSEYFRLGEMGSYILRIFGKKDPSKPKNFNLRVMHNINRISLVLFLLALLYLIGRKIF